MNIDKHNAQDYLSKVTERLKNEGFRINQNVTYNNQVFEYAAKRTKFEIERFGFFTTFFLFARFTTPDIRSLMDFSAKSFRYAKKASGIHPPLFYRMVSFSVAIVDSIDDNTIETIHKKALPNHWAAFEKLVVFNTETRMLYYCETTPSWGALYHDRDRQIINEMLSP